MVEVFKPIFIEVGGTRYKIQKIKSSTGEFTYIMLSYKNVHNESIMSELEKYMWENKQIDGIVVIISDGHAENIDFLKRFSWVKSLNLTSNDFENVDALASMVGLESLILEGVFLTPFDFSQLKRLKELRILYHHKKTNNIFDCISLEDLTIYHYKHKSKSVDEFSKLVNLKILDIRQTPIREINGLANLKKLESLELAYLSKLEDISGIESNQNITSLHIQNCKKYKIGKCSEH